MAAVTPLAPRRVLAWIALPAAAIAAGTLIPTDPPPPAPPTPSSDLDLPPPVVVTVAIDARGFEVSGPHPLLAGPGERAGGVVLPCPELPCAVTGYDHAGLSALLRDVKRATPAAELTIRPASTTPYRTVLDTVATAREDASGRLFPFVTVAAPLPEDPL